MAAWPHIRAAIATAVVVSALVGLTSCGGGAGDGGPGPTSFRLVIGAPVPLGGASPGSAYSGLGASGRKAANLAFRQIQGTLPETGAQAELGVSDQGPTATSAASESESLVGSRRASCLTGPWGADAVLKTADAVAIPSKALLISPTPATNELSDLSDQDLVNSTALPVNLEGVALTQAISDDIGGAEGRAVNVAAENDSYGNTLADSFTERWQGEKGTIGARVTVAPPAFGTAVGPGLSSSSASQAVAITAGNPAAALMAVDPEAMRNLAGSLGPKSGWDPSIGWGGDALADPSLPGAVGPRVVEGMRVVASGAPEADAAAQAFVRAFDSSAPESVELAPYAAQEFDATILCYLAAVAAGSADGQQMADELVDITAPGGERFTWQQLPDAVKALEDGEDIDYVGASGPIDMGIPGNATAGVYDVLRYSAGSLTKVGEEQVEQNPAAP